MGVTDGLVVGIDLGGTHMQFGVADPAGRVLGRSSAKTQAEDGAGPVIDRMAEGVRDACRAAGTAIESIRAVGIGAPAPIDSTRGLVTYAPNLGWRRVPLADELGSRLGGVRVFVDNDVNAAAYGEFIAGAGKGGGDLLAVWIGTGVGGGLVLGGKVHRGACFSGGEIGQMILLPRAEEGRRSVESRCARTAISREIAERSGGAEMGSREIGAAYAAGDAVVREVVAEAMDLLGVAVGSIVTLLGLPRIVIGGGLTEVMGEQLVSLVRDSTRRNVFYDTCKGVEVVCTSLRENAGVIGASTLARDWLRQ
jgi:glucokinase